MVLWELFTLGQSPYKEIPAEHQYAFLTSGQRLPQPSTCPDEVYVTLGMHTDTHTLTDVGTRMSTGGGGNKTGGSVGSGDTGLVSTVAHTHTHTQCYTHAQKHT